MHRPRLALALLTLLGLAACDLGEKQIGDDGGTTTDPGESEGDGDATTGDDDGDPPGGDTTGGDPDPNGACGAETTTEIGDLDAALPGFGHTAIELISLAEGSYSGSFSWLPNDGPLTNAHADTQSPLSAAITEVSDVRLIEVALAGEWADDGTPEGYLCTNTLEIDALLQFSTEDGLFAELLPVTLTVRSHGEQPLPGLDHSFDMDMHQGALSLDDFEFTDAVITDLRMFGEFDWQTFDGTFNMEVETMGWVGFGIIGSFQSTRDP